MLDCRIGVCRLCHIATNNPSQAALNNLVGTHPTKISPCTNLDNLADIDILLNSCPLAKIAFLLATYHLMAQFVEPASLLYSIGYTHTCSSVCAHEWQIGQ